MLEITKAVTDTQYYVFYDEWTGGIYNVATVEDSESDRPYIVTNSEIAKDLLLGHVNENDYIVSYDSQDNFTVMEKGNILRLRSSESMLRQLPNVKLSAWDIRVLVYTENNKLVIEVNPDAIRKLSTMTFNKQIVVDANNDLSLYIIKHNSPDHLIASIDVDAQELLDTGNVIYDISNIRQHISLADIGILTRRCFKNYYTEIYNSSLSVVQQSLVKNLSYVHRSAGVDLDGHHIKIDQKDDIVTFSTKLSSGELVDIGLHEETLMLHLTGDTPDQYYGSIPMHIKDLKTKKKCTVRIQGNIKDYTVLHKKNKVIFSIKGAHT